MGAFASASWFGQGVARHSVPGSSVMPPSRPRGGRRRNSTCPSASARKKLRAVALRAGFLGRLSRQTGGDAGDPCFAACGPRAQHAGRAPGADRGAEVEQRLGEIRGASLCFRGLVQARSGRGERRLGRRQRRFDREQPGRDALHIAIDGNHRHAEGDRGHGIGGVGADPRNSAQRGGVGRKDAAYGGDRLGSRMQIAGAGVIAEPRPGGHDRALIGGREILHGGEPRQEPVKIRTDSGHGGLLQHDFAQPDAVGVRQLARQRARRAWHGDAGRTRTSNAGRRAADSISRYLAMATR